VALIMGFGCTTEACIEEWWWFFKDVIVGKSWKWWDELLVDRD
jgi:hypothetical protein